MRILLHLITVIPLAIFMFVIRILGLIVVPIALMNTVDVKNVIMYKRSKLLWRERHLPRWAWLWDNARDGTLGDKRGWWRWEVCNGNPEKFWYQYRWTALRNPANNLQRIWPYYLNGLDLEKGYKGDYRVDDDPGEGGSHFVWCDWRTGFYLIKEYGFMNRCLEIRTGWKLRPEPQKDKAVGFTFLIHPWRNIA